jgi:predicted nucleic acid-binding protein
LGKGKTSVVVTDANVLINLMHCQQLDLLGDLPGFEFVVPDHVADEILRPEQKETLHEAVEAGIVRIQAITAVPVIKEFARLSAEMGRGEAACLALAVHEGWLVASDEKRLFRRRARELAGPGRLLTTPGLFVLAIRAGVMTADEADGCKAVLEENRFKMKFGSFAEVVGNDEKED